MERLARLLAGRMFELVLLTMMVAALLGSRIPGPFLALKPLAPLLVFLMLLQPGFALQLRGLRERLKRKSVYVGVSLMLYAIVYPLLLIPFIGFAATLLQGKLREVLVGGVLVALAPVAMPAPAIVSLNGGDAELSLITVVVTFLAAPFVMPLYAGVLLHRLVSLRVAAIVEAIVVFIGGSLAAGQALRYLVARAAARRGLEAAAVARLLATLLSIVSCLSLYLLVAIVTGCAARALLANMASVACYTVILLVYDTLRYIVGYAAARLVHADCPARLALVAAGSENGALGMALATPLGSLPAAGAVIAGPLLVLPTLTLFARMFACWGG